MGDGGALETFDTVEGQDGDVEGGPPCVLLDLTLKA